MLFRSVPLWNSTDGWVTLSALMGPVLPSKAPAAVSDGRSTWVEEEVEFWVGESKELECDLDGHPQPMYWWNVRFSIYGFSVSEHTHPLILLIGAPQVARLFVCAVRRRIRRPTGAVVISACSSTRPSMLAIPHCPSPSEMSRVQRPMLLGLRPNCFDFKPNVSNAKFVPDAVELCGDGPS